MTPTTIAKYLTTSSPSPSISDAEIYVVICYLSVLAVVGCAGNALVLYVFSKKKDKLTSTLFIIALATVDFITCVVVMPFTVYMEIVDFHVSSDVCCKLYQFFITSNIPFSALIMVAIAVDRYLCICHPFTGLLTINRAKILIGLLAAVAATLGACVAMFFGVYGPPEVVAGDASNTTESEGIDATVTPLDNHFPTTAAVTDTDNDDNVLVNLGHCAENDLILSHDFQWYYQKLYTFMYPACLLVVVVLYVLIYHSVLRRRYKRQQQKSKTIALVRTAQQTEDRQKQLKTSLPDGRSPMVELTVDFKTADDGGLAIDDQTVSTDINGCISLLPVGLSLFDLTRVDLILSCNSAIVIELSVRGRHREQYFFLSPLNNFIVQSTPLGQCRPLAVLLLFFIHFQFHHVLGLFYYSNNLPSTAAFNSPLFWKTLDSWRPSCFRRHSFHKYHILFNPAFELY